MMVDLFTLEPDVAVAVSHGARHDPAASAQTRQYQRPQSVSRGCFRTRGGLSVDHRQKAEGR